MKAAAVSGMQTASAAIEIREIFKALLSIGSSQEITVNFLGRDVEQMQGGS